jgi:thioredoxin 1
MALFKGRFKTPHVSGLEEFKAITESGHPFLVDFYQHGCQPCQVMDGIVNEVAEEFAGKATVVKANLESVPDLFYQFKVKSTPTFILVLPKGNQLHQVWRQSGLVKKDQIVDQLSRAISATRTSSG